MGLRIRACVLVLLLTASGALGQERGNRDEPTTIRAGNWAGGPKFVDGQFFACSAGAPNSAGTTLGVGVSRALSRFDEPVWFIELAHPSWKLEVGTAFPMDLGFDRQALFHVYGRPQGEHTLAAIMPGDAIVTRLFRSRAMYTFVQGQQYSLTLDGVSRLQPLLLQCLRTNTPPNAGQ